MAISLKKDGARIYLIGDTFPLKDQIRALGGHWDGQYRAWWVGTAKAAQVQALVDQASAAPAGPRLAEDPNEIRVVGKARYKGKSYYARFIGQTKRGYCCRLVTLDGKIDFWAACQPPGEHAADGTGEVAVVIKTYQPREYRGRMEYTTLGSLRRFIEREQANRQAGGPVCAECGRSGALVEDLEDGLMKHPSCCDIPP